MLDLFVDSISSLIANAPPVGGGAVPLGPSGTGGGAGGAAPPQGGLPPWIFLAMFGFLAFLLVSSALAGRKEKKERQSMLDALGKNDKVQVAGMIGTIVELKNDHVVVKVDESNNTRITFVRGAIQNVLKSSKKRDSDADVVPEPEKIEA
ncbi:MAG: preprotein translocase subunit YajC [Planctomycetota bacterium]